MHPVIAIDGTAASGKSTFARELAQRLGYAYVNTGAMYRGVTWYLLDRGVELVDPEKVELPPFAVATRLERGEMVFLIDGVNPASHARDGRVNNAVSVVAQIGAVRRRLVAEQQRLGELSPLVMEGRDIGTVVFPQTPYKFFIDADPDIRAARRSRQGETDVVRRRDVIDSSRKNSPLLQAPDALALDSGRYSVNEMVATALAHLQEKGLIGGQ
jgi:cytidylate kinase